MQSSDHLARAAWLLFVLLIVTGGATVGQEGQRLSLAEALAYALDHNPQIAAAVARVEHARAGVALAQAAARPSLSLSASGRFQSPPQAISIPVPTVPPVRVSRPQQGNVTAAVVWPLWTGGRVEAAVGVARAQTDAAEADLQQATEQLLFEVAQAYFGVLTSRSALTAAEAGLRRAEEDERTAQVARSAGAATTAQLSAAAAARRHAHQLRAAAQNAAADAEQSFNRLLVRPLKSPVQLLDEPLTLGLAPAPEQAAQVALAMRPELLALSHRREGAVAAIAQARAERNPTLGATAQGTWQTPTAIMRPYQEFAGLEFSWPLGDPSAGPLLRSATASADELAATERDLKAAIVLQVAQAAHQVADARELVAAAQEALHSAEETARVTRVARQAGAATKQRLTAAQSGLQEVRTRREQAEYGLSVALVAQGRALGLLRALFLSPDERPLAATPQPVAAEAGVVVGGGKR